MDCELCHERPATHSMSAPDIAPLHHPIVCEECGDAVAEKRLEEEKPSAHQEYLAQQKKYMDYLREPHHPVVDIETCQRRLDEALAATEGLIKTIYVPPKRAEQAQYFIKLALAELKAQLALAEEADKRRYGLAA